MTKLLITFTKSVIVFVLAILFGSCNFAVNFSDGVKGNGRIKSETRTITDDFKSIDVDNGIKVIVTQSPLKSVTVTTDVNLQRIIRTAVENGVLTISSTEGYNSHETPVVQVSMPHIEGLVASGGSLIVGSGVIVAENLLVKTTSGSKAEVSVEAENLAIESSSGSKIEAKGKAINLETSSSSGSSVEAGSLLANHVTSKASSGSSTEIHPIIALEARASSGSSIEYFNIPKTISKESSSAGSVSQR